MAPLGLWGVKALTKGRRGRPVRHYKLLILFNNPSSIALDPGALDQDAPPTRAGLVNAN